jgi:hypothetical protein
MSENQQKYSLYIRLGEYIQELIYESKEDAESVYDMVMESFDKGEAFYFIDERLFITAAGVDFMLVVPTKE